MTEKVGVMEKPLGRRTFYRIVRHGLDVVKISGEVTLRRYGGTSATYVAVVYDDGTHDVFYGLGTRVFETRQEALEKAVRNLATDIRCAENRRAMFLEAQERWKAELTKKVRKVVRKSCHGGVS